MFTDRLNKLFDKTGATGAEIAKLAGFDRTNISRMRSGKRIPSPTSNTAAKLIEGIYLFSDNKNDLKTICEEIGTDPTGSADVIKKQIGLWLYDGYDSLSSDTSKGRKKRTNQATETAHFFGERLSIAMNLAELSNVRLSQLLHADASLISRYRNGVRTPMANPEFSTLISEILYDRITRNDKTKELSDLLQIPIQEIDDEAFASWLYGKNELQDDSIRKAEDFLGCFDSLDPNPKSSPFSTSELLQPSTEDSPYIYYGTDEFRRAILRFLSDAITKNAKELLLYSDEDLSWMTQDPSFWAKWATLMFSCVKNGIKIRIIHNLDRDMGEMTDAIKSWLPLYMSGMIESYFCKKQKSSRFSHTLFLIPHIACIKSFHAIPSSGESFCHYYRDEKTLSICESEFESLQKCSNPLVNTLPSHSYVEASDVIAIQNALSISTMSKELAESFNNPVLMDVWKKANTSLIKKLKNNSVYELIPLAKEADFSQNMVSVAHYSSIQHNLNYNKEQYKMHIRDIIRLSEEYDSYRFYAIPEPPFQNIDIIISDNIAQITPAFIPGISFVISNPSMCNAFKAYAKTIRDKCKMDRNSLRKMLEELY